MENHISQLYGASATYEYGVNLYINMTNSCPNRCDFCLRQNSSGSLYSNNLWYQGGEPTREEFWAQLQRRDLNTYPEIVFCGYGEPACRWDDMMWLCDQIRSTGSHFIRINTNGLANLITGRNAALDLDGRVDAVSISLNASTPEGYDRLCHSRFGLRAFPAILRFTSTAVLNVPHVRMTAVSTLPKAELDACQKVAESVGADFFVREYIRE
ncbi:MULTISPECIES: TatD family nuclease-associated radical SAM protein [unclassified Acutalibacter]|jgi:TatD family-associated radical SAM protein|uniref:TatD family nuclease-associated radical SAM protein n=1 Tax=unclassified Acutalibacter TaxID=2620728 RepID=UPI0014120B87|nr:MULTISPECIES: TatD family nuclease-associated radical SAM protein [unclassified Acutalibacter]MCI9224280.1 radical SAM protein [Acutalibacter sp.]NBJ89243.1 radical SAM protein [Acutalibacter sp. 1XD8-36]